MYEWYLYWGSFCDDLPTDRDVVAVSALQYGVSAGHQVSYIWATKTYGGCRKGNTTLIA